MSTGFKWKECDDLIQAYQDAKLPELEMSYDLTKMPSILKVKVHAHDWINKNGTRVCTKIFSRAKPMECRANKEETVG